VLVDVENPSPTDRLVTLGGSLLDGENRPVSRLLPDELRIPTRGTRTFALVADAPALTATHASFKVENAVTVDYDPPVILEDPQVKLGDLAVIAAKVKNTVDKECTAVVAATFYGKDGAILTRPFTIVPLPGSASRPVRFEGPKETARAEVFIGQVAFHPVKRRNRATGNRQPATGNRQRSGSGNLPGCPVAGCPVAGLLLFFSLARVTPRE
jgi:hypothetical protein